MKVNQVFSQPVSPVVIPVKDLDVKPALQPIQPAALASKAAFRKFKAEAPLLDLDPIMTIQPIFPPAIHHSDTGSHLRKEFLQSIEKAKESIVCLTYSCSDKELIDLLLKKVEEGVDVAIVIEEKHMGSVKPHADKFKIYTRTEGEGRIHHKATVIDGADVWMGSANLSPTALTKQSNTMLQFKSKELADALIEEAEVFAGLKERSGNPPPVFNIGGQDVELLFFPHVPFNVKNSPEKNSMITASKGFWT